jgi:hypothetical protein
VWYPPPAPAGATPIYAYTVTASPGGHTATGSGDPVVVEGLSNGTAYTFTVVARNAVGTGPISAESAPVTPALAARSAAPTPAPPSQQPRPSVPTPPAAAPRTAPPAP